MPGYASGGCFFPEAATMPVHLDDDECVVHHDLRGWHCIRALHQGHPCQSPTPTQGQAVDTPQGGSAATSGAGRQGQARQRRSALHPPLPHPVAPPPTTPTPGQGVDAGRTTGNPTQPHPPQPATT